jgi:hypothetical protein
MYEDVIIFSDQGINLNRNHVKSLCLKAKSLALLLRFDEALEIYKQINYNKGI